MVRCLLVRRRIGAHLDGELGEGRSRSTREHLERCEGCRAQARDIAGLRRSLSDVFAGGEEPDWRPLWPAVVRGIEDARRRPLPALAGARRSLRWALGGAALATAVAVPLSLWQLGWVGQEPGEPVVVTSAHTDYPGGTMVYAVPDSPMKVVWVFSDP